MSRNRVVTDVRVVVEVEGHIRPGGPQAEAQLQWKRRRAEEVVHQIKRHCDDVVDVTVEDETADRCSHCDAIWTEGDRSNNGGCCDDDIEVMHDEWLDALHARGVARDVWGVDIKLDRAAWLEYFNGDFTPDEAIDEDLSNG